MRLYAFLNSKNRGVWGDNVITNTLPLNKKDKEVFNGRRRI